MRKRAQAALEFLMTYGWAILIMLVVIAVLFYLGVFNSSSSVPSSCVLPAGFTCAEFSLDSSGRLYLDLGQATGKTITVTGVGCGPAGGSVTSLSIPVTVQTGGHAVVSDSDVICSGNYSGAFKGKVSIRYQPAGAAYNKTITGDLSAPVAVVAAGEQGQWNTSYGYYRQVTVNTGVSSNLTDFPAYFALDTQHLIAYGRMNSSCKDLRVVNSTKNGVMDYEIENNTCNTTNTVVWFRVPQTNAATDYTAYVFYGNNSASDAQNKVGVWSNGFVAVYHMADTSDSTGNTIGASVGGGGTLVNGRIGLAFQFPGDYGKYINCSSGFSLGTTYSVEGWVNIPPGITCNEGRYIVVMGSGTGSQPTFSPCYWTSFRPLTYLNTSNYRYANADLRDSLWHSITFLVNGTGKTDIQDKDFIYLDSINTSSGGISMNDYPCTPLKCYIASGAFIGTIDEVRISDVVRSADWIKAEYGQTYSVGSEQVN